MEKINWHELHENKNTLRSLDEAGDLPSDAEQAFKAGVEEDHSTFKIKDFGSLTEAKTLLREQKRDFENTEPIDKEAISATLGAERYNFLATLQAQAVDLEQAKARQSVRLREMGSKRHIQKLYTGLVKALSVEVKDRTLALAEARAEDSAIARIADLLSYKKQLAAEGHIAEVPSVTDYLSKIDEAMVEGKSMFLHGPTGTGKTSLAIRAAKRLTGTDPEIVYCNPQTKESNIFGKTGIAIDEESQKQVTQFDPAPLVRAMEKGSLVIFDEFTALPQEMMVMLKGIMNAKPGDTRSVTGNGSVTISPGFQMIFTANLKSAKNPGRQELPPEMANEFSQNNLEIKYQSATESYDIALARLMSEQGSTTLSAYDLEVTLPKLCTAMVEIQQAYTSGSTSDLGSKDGLTKYVLNQRNLENILSRWNTAGLKGEAKNFSTFLDEQLAVTLQYREYSEKDRVLAAKILARHGLLTTTEPEAIGLPAGSFSFRKDAAKETVAKSAAQETFDIVQLAKADPFEQRKILNTDLDELLPPTSSETTAVGEKVTPEVINKLLEQLGIPATIDESFEGGVVEINIDQALATTLATWPKAKAAYEAADSGSESWVDSDLNSIPYTAPAAGRLEAIVLNHGVTTAAERDTLVVKLATAGYRPLEFSELIALGILKPAYNKRAETLNTYKKYKLAGGLLSPFLHWSDSVRDIRAYPCVGDWGEWPRFVFVRN